ncbi:MAG: endonuclease/exonuclease/phosphatase family protein [Endozoicomonas sp.]
MNIPLCTILLMVLSHASEVTTPASCYAPQVPRGQPIKVMTHNIQLALGEYRRFWKSDEQAMPSKIQVMATLASIEKVILDEQPDILFLQEASRHSVISHYIDQIAAIKERLGADYCMKSEYYWNRAYIPRGQMWGAMDYSLVIFTRYSMSKTRKVDLPREFSLTSWFYPYRFLMETDLLTEDGQTISLLNTHLDAHDQKGLLRLRQMAAVHWHISKLYRQKTPFILAGDFNLIPPDVRKWLPENQKSHFGEKMHMGIFYNDAWLDVVPSLENVTGSDRRQWTTAYDQNRHELDLNLDYLIYSNTSLSLISSRVMQEHKKLSDHVPVTAVFLLKEKESSSEN